jgi:TolB-like protein
VLLALALGFAAVGISAASVLSRPSKGVSRARATDNRAIGTTDRLDSGLVAVVPFNVAVSDSSLAYLGEGIVDLLAIRLSGDGGPRATDPQTVIDAWQRASTLGVPEPDAARDAARRLGAGQVLHGGIVGNRRRITVSAALIATSDGRVRAEASIEGSTDSIVVIADRLATQLLAQRSGEVEPRLASLTSTSLPALKAYLAGQASYRRGRYGEATQHFIQALDYDSTFSLAALHLGLASGWARRPAQEYDRAIRLAGTHRDRLSERDREFLALFSAPTSKRAPEIMDLSEKLVAADPDRQEVWYEYGDRLMHSGWALEINNAHERAAAAFDHALELDSLFVPAITHSLQLAARAGDTARVRRLGTRYLAIDSVGELAPFIRWRMALSERDTVLRARLRRQFDAARPASLEYITETALYDGVAIEDAQLAVDALVRHASTRDERFDALIFSHVLALSRGRTATALAITEALGEQRPASRFHLRMRVTDALYGMGDSAAAATAVAALAPYADAPPAARGDERANQYKDMCVVEQWRLAHGAEGRTRRAIDLLRAWDPPHGSNVGFGNAVCALLLDALLARRSGGDAVSEVARLEASLRSAPGIDEMLDYAPIALARLYEAQGDPAAALRAIRRRFYFAFWPHYLGTHLREEARLAALVGDERGALQAYRHYLALRSEPDPAVAVDSLRRMSSDANHRGGH